MQILFPASVHYNFYTLFVLFIIICVYVGMCGGQGVFRAINSFPPLHGSKGQTLVSRLVWQGPLAPVFKNLLLRVCECGYTCHGTCVEVRGQLLGVGLLCALWDP